MADAKVVTVGCKLPHGLKLDVDTAGKGRVRHMLKGTNSSSVVGGFGLTEIPEDFWKEWLSKNKNLSFVKNGLVWAYPSRDGAKAKAKEMAELKHGVEPLNPANKTDTRIPKNVQPDDNKDE